MTTTESQPNRHITLDLIRKRSEHNESLVSNLEEIALHQEELQAIGPVLPRACGSSLRILLLQNNVISRLDPKEMKFFKQLEYLNLALNNIQVVEGIGHLEFLNKLDLTLNFISIDRLEESLECLSQMRSLRELFFMGNPFLNPQRGGFDQERGRMYVMAKLPQLEFLDGEAITRSQRLRAKQRILELEQELQILTLKYRECYNVKKFQTSNDCVGEKELTSHCPEDRIKMSNELAKQKAEKDKNEKANQPKFKNEKDYEQDQLQAIEKARKREEMGDIKQCNGELVGW
jgi:protein TilB